MIYWITPTLLVMCWATSYAFDRKNVFGQWLFPARQRVRESVMAFLLSTSLCVLTNMVLAWIGGASWHLNKDHTSFKMAFSLFYDVNSVLAEELLFRGIITFLLLRHAAERTALITSAVIFGVYHWFSQDVFGNIPVMAIVIVITGLMGYVFAYAYAKTCSLVLPVGLHLGWNVFNNSVFSNGPNGLQLLRTEGLEPTSTLFGVSSFGASLVVGVLLLGFVKSGFVSRYQNAKGH